MTDPENIFDFYREKIETRYNIWIGFLGFFCIILFFDHYFPEEQLIVNALQKAFKFISLGLAISLLLHRARLLTILDFRYSDSVQRFEDHIADWPKQWPNRRRELLQYTGFVLIIIVISLFGLKDKEIAYFGGACIVVLPAGLAVRAWMHGQDHKLLIALKRNLDSQALDMST